MKNKNIDKEIHDVMKEEKSRSKAIFDSEARKRNDLFKRDFLRLIHEGNVEKFRAYLISCGQQPGSEKFRISMRAWNEYLNSKLAGP